MNWQQLISNKRLGQELRHTERRDERTEFKRDYDRLIFSAPFRRLQNKTQVFPLPGSVFVHNRLTHSLEVASVGMSLGADIARAITHAQPELAGTLVEELGTITATACLAHDLGNPPFGHSGEKAIQTYFTEGPGSELRDRISPECWNDLTHFEGNANAFRLLTHRFLGRRPGGFVMTYTTLAAIVKYPYPAHLATPQHPKFGFFATEADTYRRIATELGIPQTAPERYARHPLVFLVEAADDICYQIMDIEDAHKLHLIDTEHTKQLLLGFFNTEQQQAIMRRIHSEDITDLNEQIVYLRASVIGLLQNHCAAAFLRHQDEILAGTFHSSLIDAIDTPQRQAYHTCTDTAYNSIYRSKPVLDIELAGYNIMETLINRMTQAVLRPDTFYAKQLIERVSSQYNITAPDLETRLRAVVDFIAGMTDLFALDFYQKINGTALPIV